MFACAALAWVNVTRAILYGSAGTHRPGTLLAVTPRSHPQRHNPMRTPRSRAMMHRCPRLMCCESSFPEAIAAATSSLGSRGRAASSKRCGSERRIATFSSARYCPISRPIRRCSNWAPAAGPGRAQSSSTCRAARCTPSTSRTCVAGSIPSRVPAGSSVTRSPTTLSPMCPTPPLTSSGRSGSSATTTRSTSQFLTPGSLLSPNDTAVRAGATTRQKLYLRPHD